MSKRNLNKFWKR